MNKPQAGESRASQYLDPAQNLADLVSKMPAEERAAWNEYGHMFVEPTFADRVFLLYRCEGKDRDNRRRPPNVIERYRVIGISVTDSEGVVIRVLAENENKVIEIGHVPVNLGGHGVFASVPHSFTMRWDARLHDGKLRRSLAYLLLFKTRNSSAFYSRGNVYIETPNKLKKLFPDFAPEY